jgi:hypothetical protein
VVFIGLAVGDSHDLIEGARNYSHGLLLKFQTGNCDRKVLFGVVQHLCFFGREGSCDPKHCVGFPAASLPISKNSSIISIENVFY